MPSFDHYTSELVDILNAGDLDRNRLRQFVASVWVEGASYAARPAVRARNQDDLLAAVEYLLCLSMFPGREPKSAADEHLAKIREARKRVAADRGL